MFVEGSLAQALIKLTAPGVPDVYQGSQRPSPYRGWLNVLTGQRISSGNVDLSELWRQCPVALLERMTL
jgi:maltooligosyltrehalose synthase